MLLDALPVELGDFLSSWDLSTLPSLSDESDELAQPTPPPGPRKKSRKPSSLDPAAKREIQRAKDRKRCSRYRQRQRNERQNLQQQVQHLMAELLAKQEAREVSAELCTSTWKMIAQRERQAKLNAEEQQRLLCEAVETRAALIREFQELMQRIDVAEVDCQQQKRIRVESSDDAFYAVFAQDLDAIYAKTDEVLRACGLEQADEDEVDAKRMWKEDNDTGFFLFTDNQTLPLDFGQTGEALWHAAQLPHRQESRQDYRGVEDPANTSAYKFRLTNRLSTGRIVSAVQRSVVKRYREKGRMVLVWQSLKEGEGMFAGMRSGETGWDVLIPSTNPSRPGTVIKTVISHTPMQFDAPSAKEATAGQFTGMMLEAVAEDGVEIMERFEKLHIDN